MGVAAPRHICFLARKSLFRHRLFGGLIHSLNAVPVEQHGIAKEGLKTILEQLSKGQAVLVFPEGERTYTGEVQPLKPGILLLIKRIAAPIVPIGIAGAFEALPRHENGRGYRRSSCRRQGRTSPSPSANPSPPRSTATCRANRCYGNCRRS